MIVRPQKILADGRQALATLKQGCDRALMTRADHTVVDNCVAKINELIAVLEDNGREVTE